MSKNVSDAANQQGSPYLSIGRFSDPSETTRQAPFSNFSNGAIKAYLLGSLHDGTFSSNKRFRISQKGTEWLEVLKKLFDRLGYKAWIYKEGKDRDIYVLETLASFLDLKFDPLQLKNQKEKINYVKGFFDAEGGIPRNSKARFYIQLTQNDKKKLEKLKKILKDLKIETGKIHNPSRKIDPDYWRMYILANSQKRFIRKINSWHLRKIKTIQERMKI